MVFSAVSVVSLIEADDDTNSSVGIGQGPPAPPHPPHPPKKPEEQ